MISLKCRKTLLVSSALAAFAYASAVAGAVAQTAKSYQFDIPAEGLGQALKDFSAASSRQILFTNEVIGDRRTAGLRGSYTSEQALGILLAGTDLRADVSRSGVIMVRPKNVQSASIDEAPNQLRPSAAGSEMRGLEEVTVTARRREENVQTVPTSIAVVTPAKLEEAHIQDFQALQHIIPSLSAVGTFRDHMILATRGQQLQIYLDEALIPPLTGIAGGQSVGGPGLFYDLENIQLVQGPQGTLFGRNTTGGAFLFQSKRPTNNFGGYATVTYGNYNDKEIQAAINIPLVDDKVLLRVAANAQDRDGYVQQLAQPNRPNGVDLDNISFFATRATLTFKLSEAVQNDLIVNYYNSANHGHSFIMDVLNPTGVAAQRYPGIVPAFQQQQALGIRQQVPIDTNTFSHAYFASVTDILRFDLTENLTFRNIFSYSQGRYDQTLDYDGTSFPAFNRITRIFEPSNTQQYTVEPQLQGKSFDGNLQWVAGAYLLSNPSPFASWQVVSLGTPTGTRVASNVNSKAIYAQGTYNLSSWAEGLNLTLGARYTWDRPRADNQAIDGSGNCVAPCTVVSRSRLFTALTWTVGLDYRLSPDTMVYVTSRRGFKAGGYNNLAPNDALYSYGPEIATDVEGGIKSDWQIAGMPVRTNAALYWQDYSKIQTSQNVLGSAGQPATYSLINNAAAARILGAEAEASVFITPDLEVGGFFSWLDFEYTSFEPGVVSEPLIRGILYNRPQYKYGLNGRYRLFDDPQLGSVSVTANWNWQSLTRATTANPLPEFDSFQDPYGLLDMSVSWNHFLGSPLALSLFVTNATDEAYKVGSIQLYPSQGLVTLAYAEPRMFGFRMKYTFGGEAE